MPATPSSALVLGVFLVPVGLATLVLQRTGVDVSPWLGGSGWTLYVIVPGLGLLMAAVGTTGGWAKGLTVAGAILTTVGLTLLYQDQTDHYASWAYAWTLIPIAVGAAFVAHGWRVGRPDLVARGLGSRRSSLRSSSWDGCTSRRPSATGGPHSRWAITGRS